MRRACVCAALAVSVWVGIARAEAPADRFVASLEGSSAVPADARDLIKQTWAKCDGCDGEEFLTQGLAVLSPKFREGLDAFDNDKYAECAAIMRGLIEDPNAFVSANAAAYEAKALVQAEKLLDALASLTTLVGEQRERTERYTYLLPEMDFLYGFALLADLRYEEAAKALEGFLENHPQASQRLLIAAQQMLLELANREPEKIGEVVDLMSFCGRQLRLGDGGDTVRGRQDRIIELLSKLVDEAEKREQQSQSSSGGSGSNNRAPSNPMQQSQMPGGSYRGGGGVRDARRANPGDAWGAMPPAERERILQALRESFPSQYRRLVEQYYEELGKKP